VSAAHLNVQVKMECTLVQVEITGEVNIYMICRYCEQGTAVNSFPSKLVRVTDRVWA